MVFHNIDLLQNDDQNRGVRAPVYSCVWMCVDVRVCVCVWMCVYVLTLQLIGVCLRFLFMDVAVCWCMRMPACAFDHLMISSVSCVCGAGRYPNHTNHTHKHHHSMPHSPCVTARSSTSTPCRIKCVCGACSCVRVCTWTCVHGCACSCARIVCVCSGVRQTRSDGRSTQCFCVCSCVYIPTSPPNMCARAQGVCGPLFFTNTSEANLFVTLTTTPDRMKGVSDLSVWANQ